MFRRRKAAPTRWQTFVVTKALVVGGTTWQPGQRGHIYKMVNDRITPTGMVAWHGTTLRQAVKLSELQSHVRIIRLDKVR